MTDKQLAIIELNRILADRRSPALRMMRACAVALEAALEVLAEDEPVDAPEGITPEEIRTARSHVRKLRTHLDRCCKRFEGGWE